MTSTAATPATPPETKLFPNTVQPNVSLVNYWMECDQTADHDKMRFDIWKIIASQIAIIRFTTINSTQYYTALCQPLTQTKVDQIKLLKGITKVLLEKPAIANKSIVVNKDVPKVTKEDTKDKKSGASHHNLSMLPTSESSVAKTPTKNASKPAAHASSVSIATKSLLVPPPSLPNLAAPPSRKL